MEPSLGRSPYLEARDRIVKVRKFIGGNRTVWLVFHQYITYFIISDTLIKKSGIVAARDCSMLTITYAHIASCMLEILLNPLIIFFNFFSCCDLEIMGASVFFICVPACLRSWFCYMCSLFQ